MSLQGKILIFRYILKTVRLYLYAMMGVKEKRQLIMR